MKGLEKFIVCEFVVDTNTFSALETKNMATKHGDCDSCCQNANVLTL